MADHLDCGVRVGVHAGGKSVEIAHEAGFNHSAVCGKCDVFGQGYDQLRAGVDDADGTTHFGAKCCFLSVEVSANCATDCTTDYATDDCALCFVVGYSAAQ